MLKNVIRLFSENVNKYSQRKLKSEHSLYIYHVDAQQSPDLQTKVLKRYQQLFCPELIDILEKKEKITAAEAEAVFKFLKPSNIYDYEMEFRNLDMIMKVLQNLEFSQDAGLQEFMMHLCEQLLSKVLFFRNNFSMEKIRKFEESILKWQQVLFRQKYDKYYHVQNFLSFYTGKITINNRENLRLMFARHLCQNPQIRNIFKSNLQIYLDFQSEIQKVKYMFYGFDEVHIKRGIVNNALLFYDKTYMKFLSPEHIQFQKQMMSPNREGYLNNPRSFYCYFYQTLQLYQNHVLDKFIEEQFFRIYQDIIIHEYNRHIKQFGAFNLILFVPSLIKKGLKISKSIINLLYCLAQKKIPKQINDSQWQTIKYNLELLLKENMDKDLIDKYINIIQFTFIKNVDKSNICIGLDYLLLFKKLNDNQLCQLLIHPTNLKNHDSYKQLQNLKDKILDDSIVNHDEFREFNFPIDTNSLNENQKRYFLQALKTSAIGQCFDKTCFIYYMQYSHEQTIQNLQKELKFIQNIRFPKEFNNFYYPKQSKNDFINFYLGHKIHETLNKKDSNKPKFSYLYQIFFQASFESNFAQQGEKVSDLQKYIIDDICDSIQHDSAIFQKYVFYNFLLVLDYYNLLSCEPTDKLCLLCNEYLQNVQKIHLLLDNEIKILRVVLQYLKKFNKLDEEKLQHFQILLENEQCSQKNIVFKKFYEETQFQDQQIEFI